MKVASKKVKTRSKERIDCTKNKHAGSTFDSFLEEDEIAAEVEAKAEEKRLTYQRRKRLELRKKAN